MTQSSDDNGSANRDDCLNPEKREAMRERLLERAAREMTVTRRDQQSWRSFLPGIRVKVLHTDNETSVQTALWRLDAGARIPAHPHDQDEECFVLEGVLEHRGERFEAGDFMMAPAGSRHSQIRSPDGALMLIRGERVRWHERLLLRAALALGR